ncbi:MAG TPA: YciI family protein [Thermoanaerobaculia bacterium]|nr:YciI family protein [Thermoanaerobaculia bacterium]
MKRMQALLILFFLCVPSMIAIAEEPSAKTPSFDPELARKLGADERGMKTYVLCILKTGPNDAKVLGKERETVFAGHFANIGRLAKEGKLVVAGPFGKNDRSYRGLYIFNVPILEEAEKLVILDPAVKAGVFVYELTPWYASAAMMLVPETHKRIEKPSN